MQGVGLGVVNRREGARGRVTGIRYWGQDTGGRIPETGSRTQSTVKGCWT